MARPPDNAPQAPQTEALSKWPRCPTMLQTDAEQAAWRRLGVAAMAAGTVSAGDLLVAAECARVMARVDALYVNPNVKASTLASWVKIQTDLYRQLGLSPQARGSVTPPKPAAPAGSNPYADLE